MCVLNGGRVGSRFRFREDSVLSSSDRNPPGQSSDLLVVKKGKDMEKTAEKTATAIKESNANEVALVQVNSDYFGVETYKY
jgi:hypothetical protein